MLRLEGKDAFFLYQETPAYLNHTLKIHIADAVNGNVPYSLVREGFQNIVDSTPIFRSRVSFVPLGLHHPVMYEDPEFDIDGHIIRYRIPSPAEQRDLEHCIAHIASGELDKSKPLWELWILEGLENNKFALVLKLHHALADGIASVELITRLWSQSTGDNATIVRIPYKPEQVPSRLALVAGALKEHVKYDIINFPAFLAEFLKVVGRVARFSKRQFSPTVHAIQNDIPRTHFNYALSGRRSFALGKIPLADIQDTRKALNCTINDVVLFLATTSLRNYLISKNDLPDMPLCASVPTSADEGETRREIFNNTAAMMVRLPVEIASPTERLKHIKSYVASAKAEIEVMGKSTFGRLLHYVPPFIWSRYRKGQYLNRAANSDNYKPPSNLTISNVPGPKTALGKGMYELQDLYSFGPLTEGMGLNITVWSYAGDLNFSILGCKRQLPTVRPIRDGLYTALDDLALAADQLATKNGKP